MIVISGLALVTPHGETTKEGQSCASVLISGRDAKRILRGPPDFDGVEYDSMQMKFHSK